MTAKERYLLDFKLSEIDTEYFDVVIIGSGIAGIYTALESPPGCKVGILTKDNIDVSNSILAQGGIAVSLDREDSPELHFNDTIYAGAGLCDAESVWVLVNEAAENIKTLFKYGVNFDKKNKKEIKLSREAAHSKNRIIHAGDTTGKEVCDKLTAVAYTRKNIFIKENHTAVDIITIDGQCKGVISLNDRTGKLKAYLSNIVICATGGYGQLYKYTTNPEVSTGDGISMAFRAGAKLMDLEFVQFHPTVLQHPENRSFLISEAVRGEGGILKNVKGECFMEKYHEMKELAPRDVVSRAIFEEMQKNGSKFVYLDISFKDKDFLINRFPNIYKTCLNYGIDITKEGIPVAPAEHYCMGGIKTNIFGKTSIGGLYACGETACNGIHGANRLASNSLLEGLVFGRKIGDEIMNIINEKGDYTVDYRLCIESGRKEKKDVDSAKIINELKEIMTGNVGITRNKEGLTFALDKINEYYKEIEDMKPVRKEDFLLINMITLAKEVVCSALKRKESRGAHYREDYRMTDDGWKKNIVVERTVE